MAKRNSSKGRGASKKGGVVDAEAVPMAALPAGKTETDFPIVGIGASAGGLAAFEAFFSGMPEEAAPGMAFVLVQHLAPDHKSLLKDLIQRYTKMKVFLVEDGMEVQPNCAYIIPPGRDMAFLGGALQLFQPAAPRGQRMPIDFLFRSLAQDQGHRAIGVVLSGTGSDGTMGIRDIKGEGGMVMVQDPESTEYDGMPNSALATGLVDFQLAPAEMPSQIIAYVARALGSAPGPIAGGREKNTENALRKVFVLLRAQTGHDFSQYKPTTIHRRIDRRMAVHQIETIDNYVKYLQHEPGEIESLFRDLLIGVTSFFRDAETFGVLEEHIIPRLLESRPADSSVRVWVAGCATGEEAYSLAMLIAEAQEKLKRSFRVQVFATDIDSNAIETARAAVYPASIAEDVDPERLARFFTAEPDGKSYRIHKGIRDMLVFSEQNVIKDPPFSRLDLISCRNVMIYMGVELQRNLIPLFHYALNPGGCLFLGTSETVGEYGDLFETTDSKAKIYRKTESMRRPVIGRFAPPLSPEFPPIQQAVAKTPRKSLRQITERVLLRRAFPAAALVTRGGDILYLHGRTGLFLEPAPGESGVNNILKMARQGLRRELAIALREAASTLQEATRSGIRVKTNGAYSTVSLTVHPVKDESETGHFLVVLEGTPPEVPREGTSSDQPQTDDADTKIAALQLELRAKEEYLQSTNEELETANEELKSSNEEMQSVNEELQSTNEELETSKEELQSVNEELATVNAELQTKVSDLTQANDDMNNLLAGTGIATLFVDHKLRIMRFTPAATSLINLIPADVGRPLRHLQSNFAGYGSLAEDAQSVLDNLRPVRREVKANSGPWFSMSIQPYRTLSNVIEGAVVTFVDISEAKRLQAEAEEHHLRFTEAVVGSVSTPMLVLGSGARIVTANRTFCGTFGVSLDALVGETLYEVMNARWDLPELRSVLDASLRNMVAFEAHEVSIDFGPIGWRNLRMGGQILDFASEEPVLVLAIANGTRESPSP